MLPYLLAFCRLTIGLLFAYSFVGKVRNVDQFAQTITNFKLLPRRWSQLVALPFLSAELAVVVLLFVGGRWLLVAFGLAALLLVAFTLAILSALLRDIQTSCNCFGHQEKQITYYDVGRNVGFIGCSLLGWWLIPQAQKGLASQNWLALAWDGLGAIGEGNGLLTILIISAILTWLVLLLVIFFMLVLAKRFRQLSQVSSPKEHILKEARHKRGQPALEFEARNMAEEIVTLDTFKGTAVAFIFLSPSCKPCVEKIPELNSYYRQGEANGMEMVIVNVDPHISPETFAQQHGVQIPILWAPQVSNSFAHNYGADSTPSFCLVDAEQYIRAAGLLDTQYWQDQLALMWS